jgi:hypothetical protein
VLGIAAVFGSFFSPVAKKKIDPVPGHLKKAYSVNKQNISVFTM